MPSTSFLVQWYVLFSDSLTATLYNWNLFRLTCILSTFIFHCSWYFNKMCFFINDERSQHCRRFSESPKVIIICWDGGTLLCYVLFDEPSSGGTCSVYCHYILLSLSILLYSQTIIIYWTLRFWKWHNARYTETLC